MGRKKNRRGGYEGGGEVSVNPKAALYPSPHCHHNGYYAACVAHVGRTLVTQLPLQVSAEWAGPSLFFGGGGAGQGRVCCRPIINPPINSHYQQLGLESQHLGRNIDMIRYTNRIEQHAARCSWSTVVLSLCCVMIPPTGKKTVLCCKCQT